MRRGLLPAVLVALAAAAVLWFLNTHERVPVQEWVGPSGEARRNPYLAAERFALRMGLRARHVRTTPELDSLAADGVLLMPNRRQAIDPRRMRDLAGWVEGGGHLIAEAELPGVADPLLDVFGVQRTAAPPQAKPVAVELPGGRTLNVTLHGPAALKAAERDVTWRAGSPDGAQLLSFTHGRGNFTAVSSLSFARNSAIATQDNAEFLWQLTELSPTTELRVYLPPERLSLWSFLTAHAAPVLTAAAALLVLWLWRIAPRFGPVAPDLPPARRRLLDHLRASGRYYWSAGRRGRLVVAAREAALRRMARAQPDFAFAPAAERAARLSALAALPKEDAERFLAAEDSVRGADFVRLMHTSQRIHSALEKGNR